MYFVQPVVLWDLFFDIVVHQGHTGLLHSRLRMTTVLTVPCYKQDTRQCDLQTSLLLSLVTKMSFLYLDIPKKTFSL